MTALPLPNVKACVFDAYGTLFDFATATRLYVADSTFHDRMGVIGSLPLTGTLRRRIMVETGETDFTAIEVAGSPADHVGVLIRCSGKLVQHNGALSAKPPDTHRN
jgi:hypothetical protein